MKKIFAIGLAALVLASCEMDFYPSNSMSAEQLSKDPDAPIYSTDGIYTLFQNRIAYKGQDGGESGNYYIRHYFQLTELRGDNVTVSGVTEDPFVFPYGYTDINTEKNIYYTWWMAYKIIYTANANLDFIKPGVSDFQDHLIGENYFFRALGHFHMVTLFAMPYAQGRDNMGVPLRLSTDTFTTTRASVGEVYDAIVEDLLTAKEYLSRGESERIKGNDKGYVSKDAATALLARVYLYMDENEKCLEQCDELMAHAPAAVTAGYDFADYPTHTYDHPETIWCVHLDTEHEWAIDHGEASIASMYIKDGIGWGEHYWREQLIDLFMRYPEDKRFKAYFRAIEAHDVITPDAKTGYDKVSSEGSIKTIDEMYQLFPDTYVVSYPVKVDGPTYSYAQGAISIGATRNADGSINFYHLEKDPSGAEIELPDGKKEPVYIQYNHVAKRKIENRDTIYYVENDSHFLGTQTDGLYRVWVRPGPGHATRKWIQVKQGAHKGEWYQQSQSAADARFNSLISRNDNGGAYRRYYNTKFSYQDGLPMLTSPVMLRWGEVVLNRAEALAKLNRSGEALADVNTIRARAGIAPLTSGDLAANGYDGANPTLQAVLDERRKELCFEGHRFFDVFRNNLPMDRQYTGYHPWEIIQPNDPRIALLISQDEINSSGIPQNPR